MLLPLIQAFVIKFKFFAFVSLSVCNFWFKEFRAEYFMHVDSGIRNLRFFPGKCDAVKRTAAGVCVYVCVSGTFIMRATCQHRELNF